MKAQPHRAITDVAVSLEFSTSAEFAREFRREYGVAPSKWDRRSRVDQRSKVNAEPATTAMFDAAPRIVEHSPCRIVFVRLRTWFQIPVLKGGLQRDTSGLDSTGFEWRSAHLVGKSWDNYETTPLERVAYDLGFVVPPRLTPPVDMGVLDLPGHGAVHLHCHGELRLVADAWDYLYDRWFPASDREPGHLPSMTWFNRRPDELGWVLWDLDRAIPIRDSRR